VTTSDAAYNDAMTGKYRIRTFLRGNLPGQLSDLFPKGRRDCGAHEWYRSSDALDRCYHCTVGERRHLEALGPFDTAADVVVAASRAERTPSLTLVKRGARRRADQREQA